MPDYRRHRVPGGTYFFTVNLRDRSTSLLVDHIDLLRACVRRARQLAPFHIDAWVVLPDHMHALWTLPPDDTAYPRRWHTIKRAFSIALPAQETISPSRQHQGERGIWQRRYWEHTIRDDTDYAAHMDYIHFNPVKHGLAPTPAAWPYTSFHTCGACGLYPPTWATTPPETRQYGEPQP